MGFDTGAASNNQSNVRQVNAKDTKAHGFINLYLPGQNGQRKKLGTIFLREGTPNEKALSQWLAADGNETVAEQRLQQLINTVQMDFNLAETAANNGFALVGE